jgi:hypothetical protein
MAPPAAAQRPQPLRFCYRSAQLRATPAASLASASHCEQKLCAGLRPSPSRAIATKGAYCRQHSWRLCREEMRSVARQHAGPARGHRVTEPAQERGSMLRVTGTTAVTAGLGALVLLNGILSWSTRRTEPRAEQDVFRPNAATLDPGAALQLRPAAWRPWPAPAEPATPVLVAPQPPVLAATQPDIPVAVPAEASASLGDGAPIEHVARSIAPPSPQAPASDATLTATPTPPVGAPEVSRPPLAKDRMSLAGPDAELGPVTSAHTGHDATPARPTQSPPAAEPPGNASAPPVSEFGPDNLKRLERNGF